MGRSSAEYARAWYQRNREAVLEQVRYRRRMNPISAIYVDTRRNDRKKGRENDLDHDFIRRTIGEPCVYCGEPDARRSLDRIDNAKGHTKANVVSSSERCNYERRDMPYEACLVVAPGMRLARELELFGDWNGGIHHRRLVRQVSVQRVKREVVHGTLAGYKKCKPRPCQPCKDAMARWKSGRRALSKS